MIDIHSRVRIKEIIQKPSDGECRALDGLGGFDWPKMYAEICETIGKEGRVVYVNLDKTAVIVRFDDIQRDWGYSMKEIEEIS